ncbi:MgtC/SapB family protein [Bradyrhizobium sp.]|uniref:MgtC/SapB family protein n=1 Tax=Bradyrhizobium sp. TaxID=376 RepID=UPI0039E298BE
MLANQEILLRLCVAAACGSIIGFERERLLWTAGIRTHMLVCVGACLIMIVSAFGFSESLVAKNVVLDPSRVAAQVVSGVGFLGAGAILARNEVVRGLTTAASVWSVAAIGLAVGGGLYFAAGASTAIIILILAGVKPLEEAYRARNQSCQFKIGLSQNAVIAPEDVQKALGLRSNQVKRFLVRPTEAGSEVTVYINKVSSRDIKRYRQKLDELDGVEEVQVLEQKRGNGG